MVALQGIWRLWVLSSKLKAKQKNKKCVPVQNSCWAAFTSEIVRINVLIFSLALNSVSMFLCHTVISFPPSGVFHLNLRLKCYSYTLS